ncbi:MAG: PAS domain S-box protein [Flavobacteriales bacterium]|nr:PAS domain S-box protein [Flavobacteriales bacterium]
MKAKLVYLIAIAFAAFPYSLKALNTSEKTDSDAFRQLQITNYTLVFLIIVVIIGIIVLIIRNKKRSTSEEQIDGSSNEDYLRIFEHSLDAIITTDTKARVTNMNKAAEEMLEYSLDELKGKDINMLFASPEEAFKVKYNLGKSEKFQGEIFNKKKSGAVIITRLSANQIRNEAGKLIGTMGISKDITQETALRDEYNKLIDNVSAILYTTDLNGVFTYVNQPVESILGYSINEAIGRSFHEFIHKDDLEMVQKHYAELFQNLIQSSYLEFRIHTKKNEVVWVGQQVNTQFSEEDNQRIEGYYGILRIIDERKRAELKLLKSEKKYRELIDNTTDLVQIIDKDGKFLFVNRAWKRTMKYTKKELEGLNVFDLLHEESKQHCHDIFSGILAKQQTETDRLLYSLVSKDGERIVVEGNFSVKYDQHQNIVYIQSFLRDVTLQNEAEIQLAQKENTLRQITETINDVFYLYNIAEKKYEYISRNCKDILGASDQFFYEGRSHTEEFGHPDDIKKLKEANYNVDHGDSYDINFRIIVNGETRWINEKSFAIRDENGAIVANSGICRDITDIREANETIRLQNLEIGASILYAKRIQDAVLPSKMDINAVFPDSFVIFKPKDVVSGDFYIVENIKTMDGFEVPAFIVGDCTGHGVPGAVLSLMCNVLVRESFNRHDVHSPAEALEYVRQRLTNFFGNTSEGSIRDGMDISFCTMDDENSQLYFCGANSKCILVRDGELTVYRGHRQHVGYDENPMPFENHVIDVQPGDRVYLYTDGLTDQFGGSEGKKFGKVQLHKLLKNPEDLSMNELGEHLTTQLETWQGTTEQVDDITILGIQL